MYKVILHKILMYNEKHEKSKVCYIQCKKYFGGFSCYDQPIFSRVFDGFFLVKTTHLFVSFLHNHFVESKKHCLILVVLYATFAP